MSGDREADGRERLAERARQEDLEERGERDRDRAAGDYGDPADPLMRARSQAADANAARDGEGDGDVPGMTPEMERVQREDRMA